MITCYLIADKQNAYRQANVHNVHWTYYFFDMLNAVIYKGEEFVIEKKDAGTVRIVPATIATELATRNKADFAKIPNLRFFDPRKLG